MAWQNQLQGDSLSWLCEMDEPGVRYLALRDIVELPQTDPELLAVQAQAHKEGPIAVILDMMAADGYWVKPGPGYNPKYRSSVWSLISLAQLGASVNLDGRIRQASEYILIHSLTKTGQFSISGAPSGTVVCLQGNLCAALVDLGVVDRRLDGAFEWMARSLTGEGVASIDDKSAEVRYYAGHCGPGFACGGNNKMACAWGAVKVMLAFSKLAPEAHTPLIRRAIQQGVDFLFSVDPASAEYPSGEGRKPSHDWWKFGFPVFYITDLLQLVEALVRLGYGNDVRLTHALEIIRQKQDRNGRWNLEFDYSGKMWLDYGDKKQVNKWVTLRALRVLKWANP